MTTKLFEPLSLRGLTIPNRIVVEPMTQFSADQGVAGNWHMMHLGQYAVSGAGMVLTESCYVDAIARNNPKSLALYTDDQEAALANIGEFFHQQIGGTVFGPQLCHGGRKASSRPHWEGGGKLAIEDGGYEAVAPSPIAIREGWPVPRELTISEIQDIVRMFQDSAVRAERANLDVIELHYAHGYLVHEFLSPKTNQRTDLYGGSLENRLRLATEVFEAVRSVWPSDKPLGVRVSATDWVEDGWDVEQTIALAKRLDLLGCDFMDVSSGGLVPEQKITAAPGYQVPLAAAIKAEVDMKIIAVGMITEPAHAEEILQKGQADMIGLARVILYNPRWPWMAAHELGAEATYPNQYARANPKGWGHPGVALPGNVMKSN
jgi:2,4-dienoyl-CoA reductase-like NADH-dependent reductase (Old Yellow Enzyme family)